MLVNCLSPAGGVGEVLGGAAEKEGRIHFRRRHLRHHLPAREKGVKGKEEGGRHRRREVGRRLSFSSIISICITMACII